jgi:putative transposase
MMKEMIEKIVKNEDQSTGTNEAANKNKQCQIHQGEPGCNVVIDLKNGRPVIENPPVALAPRSSSSLPSVIQPQIEYGSPTPSNHDKIAYYRLALIRALWKEMAQKPEVKKHKIIKRFLRDYNSGSLLPETYEKLGCISRPTIYRWTKSYNEGDVKALVPRCRGPEASPITDQEKYILLSLLLHQNRLKIGTAIKFTKIFLGDKKMPSPSSESKLRRFVDDFRSTHNPAWVMAREGAKALNDKCLPYAERDWRLLTVGEGLVADGHRLNFQVVNPFTGKPCRATIVLFWDWKSAYPLGWEIMLEENVQCIASALRNAILTLGKIPKWLLIDNGKAFKAKIFTSEMELEDGILYGMFATLGIHTHFSQAYNAQEKPLERFWGTFNNWFERLFEAYTGNSISDKPAWMRRNEKEAQARHGKSVPKIEEVHEHLRSWIDFYAGQPSRGRDGMRPREIFEAEKGPGVDPLDLHHLMMVKEKMRVNRNGVTFNGWHYYDEALSDIDGYVVGKYSLADYSQIFCFYKNEFRCVAKPVERVHPMASESEFPRDREAVKRIAATKSRIRREARNFLTLIEAGGKEIDLDRSFEKSPEVAEVVRAIEEKKKPAPFVSPFLDEPQAAGHRAQSEKKEETRPWFADEYERYGWVMRQESINQEDRDFIPDFRSRALLYKNTTFDDEEELDRKVIRYQGAKMEPQFLDQEDLPQFKHVWQCYDYLLKRKNLTEDQTRFIKKYESGAIAPGEWEKIYGKSSGSH